MVKFTAMFALTLTAGAAWSAPNAPGITRTIDGKAIVSDAPPAIIADGWREHVCRIAGIQSFDLPGDENNAVHTVMLPPGSRVTGFGIDSAVRSEPGLDVNVAIRVSNFDNPSNGFTFAAAASGRDAGVAMAMRTLASVGAADIIVGPTGLVRVEFFSPDDRYPNLVDSEWVSGTISLLTDAPPPAPPLPEPLTVSAGSREPAARSVGNYATSFEAAEGFLVNPAPRSIDGQQGWGASGTNLPWAFISTTNPGDGLRHLRTVRDVSVGANITRDVFSPDLGEVDEIERTITADVFISNAGGSRYDLFGQELLGAECIPAGMAFLPGDQDIDGFGPDIYVATSGCITANFSPSGDQWTPNQHKTAVMNIDPASDVLRYYYGGKLIYDVPGGVYSTAEINQLSWRTNNNQLAGEFADVDAISSLATPDPCCLFTTGFFDRRSGQRSQIHLDNGGPISPFDYRGADDFYLEPGFVYQIGSISGQMLARSTVAGDHVIPSAICELYEDCNGVPADEPFLVLESAIANDSGNNFNFGGDVFQVFDVVFPTPELVLKGGKTYWISLIGIGNLNGSEEWYWGTAADIIGHQGKFKSETYGPVDWTDSEEGCCGCTDYNFCVAGVACKILYDNSLYDTTGGTPSIVHFNPDGSVAANINNVRAADQFVTLTCNEDQAPCYIEAYIYTDCTFPTGFIEIYERECEALTVPPSPPDPDCNLPKNDPPLRRFQADNFVDTGERITINGIPNLKVICLQFWNFDGFVFDAGKTYFISAFPRGTNSLGEHGFFAHAKACSGECSVRFFPGVTRGPGLEPQEWERIDTLTDFAFMVALDTPQLMGPSRAVCAADVNFSGSVTVQDLFDFLAAYFEGCP